MAAEEKVTQPQTIYASYPCEFSVFIIFSALLSILKLLSGIISSIYKFLLLFNNNIKVLKKI